MKNLFAATGLKLNAQPLGIRKLDVGAGGGRIQFTEKPDIDFARIIHLVQTRPKVYRLDPPDRLRFFGNLSDVTARVERAPSTD